MGDVGASLQGAGSAISDGDDGAGAGAGPGAGAGASAYGVGGAGASAAGTSVSSVSAAITVWLGLSAAAKLCNHVLRLDRAFAAVFYVQNDCSWTTLPRETVRRGGSMPKPRGLGQAPRPSCELQEPSSAGSRRLPKPGKRGLDARTRTGKTRGD